MSQFKFIFNEDRIYSVLFINIKAVTEYPNVKEFIEKDEKIAMTWTDMAMKRYNNYTDNEYHEYGCFLPEVSKIVCASYGNIYKENGETKRNLGSIVGEEKDILEEFFAVLNAAYEGSNNIILCGHNVTGHKIPFLVKRGLKHDLPIPQILKDALSSKPWENNVMDTVHLWKFGGNEYISLKLIANFLGLKTNVELVDTSKLSSMYYSKLNEDATWLKTLSINELNLVIQLVRRLTTM